MIHANTPIDALTRDGRTLLLFERSVVELGPLGVAVAQASVGGITLDALTDHLVATLGAPPEGSAHDAVRAAVDDLVERGVLRRGEPDAGVRPEHPEGDA